MALRAFTAVFRCAIDVDEADETESGRQRREPSLNQVKQYLKRALNVDLDTEDNGNPVGMQSVEVNIETLQELTPAEVKRDYGK